LMVCVRRNPTSSFKIPVTLSTQNACTSAEHSLHVEGRRARTRETVVPVTLPSG
jgi:hypothetical protein